MNPNPPPRDIAGLLAWLEQQYDRVRQLPDGSIAAMSGLMFTTGVYLGVNRWGFERRYCFASADRARAVFDGLQSEEDEPAGWITRRPERPEDIAAKARPGFYGGDPNEAGD